MWWLLKRIFVGPPSATVEIPLRRRMNALEADVEQLQSNDESRKGQVLTLQRRVGKLERYAWDDEDEGDEFEDMLEEKRKHG